MAGRDRRDHPLGISRQLAAIERRDWLRTVLTDAVVDAGIRLRHRTRVESVASDDDHAIARWAGGGSSEADLVVGAAAERCAPGS